MCAHTYSLEYRNVQFKPFLLAPADGLPCPPAPGIHRCFSPSFDEGRIKGTAYPRLWSVSAFADSAHGD